MVFVFISLYEEWYWKQIAIQNRGKMERWKDGKMERWKDGKMER